MNISQDTIVQLDDYPPDKYNVLVPVTSMQAMSNMQRVMVNRVKLDANPNGKDIYYDKQSRKYAITAVGGNKLAAAANISIIYNQSEQPEVCKRCIQMAKATGNAQACGNCAHVYDVKHTVTVRVPEPSGGFRLITKSKEIDCSLEKESMTEAQYKSFLPHRASIAETKAHMRCFRAALGLAQGYTIDELKKTFVIAFIVPNLDAPEMRMALINNSLRDMGLLFETPNSQSMPIQETSLQSLPDNATGMTDNNRYQKGAYNGEEFPDTEAETFPWDNDNDLVQQKAQEIICEDCGKEISETMGKNGQKWTPEAIRNYSEKRFGRCLCTTCQQADINRRNGQ